MADVESICSLELRDSAKTQADFGKINYRSTYSQYLSMANALPYVLGENGDVEGFGCAESVVTAFNLALLMRHAKQVSSVDGHITWGIGDCSMDEFIASFHNPLPFDAKRSLSAGLYEHCANSPDDWCSMGELSPQESIDPGENAKDIWREFKEILKQRAQYLIERHRSSSGSPPVKRFIPQSGSSLNLIEILSYASTDDNPSQFRTIDHLNRIDDAAETESRHRQWSLSQGSPIVSFFLSRSKSMSETSETLSSPKQLPGPK